MWMKIDPPHKLEFLQNDSTEVDWWLGEPQKPRNVKGLSRELREISGK